MLIARILLPFGVTKDQFRKLKTILPVLTPAEERDFYLSQNPWGQYVPTPMCREVECYVDEATVDGQAMILRERPPKDAYVVLDWYERNVTVAIDKLFEVCPDITFQVVEFLGEEKDND